MFNLDKIVRPNIQKLKAYCSARDEFKGTAEVYLDANENPFGILNRYPDPRQIKIKERLSVLKKVTENQIFIGNGSDEVIDLAFRIFCEPSKDKALTFSPTYGMYDVSANINDVELIKQPLLHDFKINLNQLQPYLDMEDVKIIFICSPNNPTGNCFDDETIEYILENFNGIVLIDEAYIDFSSRASYSTKLEKYPNLIVSQTFSKAWGLAGVRVGVAYANSEVIDLYNKVKPPYNVSTLNQEAVIASLYNLAQFEINKNIIINEKETLINELKKIDFVKNIYPTEANFILIEVKNANLIYNKLVSEKIIIRNRTTLIDNCLRITVGKSEENKRLITVLASLKL
ncbi:histidinol-phosphate transaminase [Tenacibaculum finnmarkense]|uniref:Histidinol-phosphate aminotransferase n=1 Tax=Tenacibaculum finnmarkense genomovar finnmarkense TaxID=1458503 RepID=A0AAP1RGA6_9FLAO|nr:histidinol-phosphate transaminase [Tenacibaculum finnmarkense]MBE7653500.1 histidinol-phosphate transaminase [Tenacibaculum finnmarkense genomovar finnmarkense]MBE7695804.1 histidinol-phosphate transaminase [Tenacibaculum finnmarkense genomovar finnmarkense]MCD8427934.1 histidinol-phosphate transaminase [Tenacibaculum finnmarkense genomovar finnmarkense]MCG8731584.1 histidinol-phosphate transaminase [Tenacibaculum finnmarkense]MCG8751494.1 histidinol-phosphate transaminase [Tenacibaculum fi